MEKKLTQLNHKLIGLLILAQPFIIMFQTMVVRDVQLFGLSIFEGFNILMSIACVCLTIYTHQKKKVFLKYIPYVVLLGLYTLAHGYNTYLFDNSIYHAQSPNFFVESYYLFRTFIVPLLLMFAIFYSGMKKEKVIRILEYFLFVFVSVMVVTNFLKIALINYEEALLNYQQEIRQLSFFDWFTFENTYSYSYYELTTKGWFLSGNELSAVLFMTLPIVIYRAYKMRDIFHYILVVLQMLAMYMLGTKVANMGVLLMLIAFIGLWCFFALLKHKKENIIAILLITLVFAAIFPFTPIGYKYRYELFSENVSSQAGGLLLEQALAVDVSDEDEFDEEMQEYYENLIADSMIFKDLDGNNLSKEEKKFVKEYMTNYCGYFGIAPFIIRHYDDLEHSKFWVNYLQKTPNNDYRVLKTMILEDIYNNNNNPLDKYLGMGYTTNYIYTEADYTHQYYNYGMIGMIVLIGPYFIFLLYVIYKGIRNFKDMFTLELAMCFIAPFIGLAVAKLSGHVFERVFPLMTIAILCGILYLQTQEKINKNLSIRK